MQEDWQLTVGYVSLGDAGLMSLLHAESSFSQREHQPDRDSARIALITHRGLPSVEVTKHG